MPYLLDTYNILHAAIPMSGAVSDLTVRSLCQWILASPQRLHATLVLDGRPKPDEPSPNEFPDLDFVYSGAGVSADTVIAQILERSPSRKKFTVVTNDRAVAAHARRHSAKTLASETFLLMLVTSERRQNAAARANLPPHKTAGKVSPGETDHWLKEFGFTPPPPIKNQKPKIKNPETLSDDDIQRLMGAPRIDSRVPPIDNECMQTAGEYRLVRPEGNLALRGLRVLVGGPEYAPNTPLRGKDDDIDIRVKGFLDYARFAGVDVSRQILALTGGTGASSDADIIAGMCLWVPSPGRTAMMFAPNLSEFPETASATGAALTLALADARAQGIVVMQAMLEPADAAGKTVFSQAGLIQLATLTYMERKPPLHPPPPELPDNLTLEPYAADTHDLFCQAIAESYKDTLDCPALSGMREMEDVIAGHKAVGPFDPQLWSVVLRDGTASGCLLLSEIPARRGLELVYLGLAPAARGQGLGRALMRRVLAIAARRHFDVATLAVDAANIPALKLYRRCGYTSMAQRIAMVKRLN